MCREWQKPPGKDDEHHPICVNKASWESQQAHDPDAPRDRVVVSTTVARAAPSEGSAPAQPPPPAVEAEPSRTCTASSTGTAGGRHRAGCIRVDPVYQPFLDSLLKYLAGENKGLAS